MDILIKTVLTFILLALIFVIWTNDIDVRRTVIAPLASIVKFKKHHTLDVDFRNVMAVRVLLKGNTQSGNLGLVFYDIKIVNTLDESMTLKELRLRYTLNRNVYSTDSYVMQTGTVSTAKDAKDAIVMRIGEKNIVLMGWVNLRSVIGEHKILPPGGVLAGSAAFVFSVNKIDDFAAIRSLELVAVDYSGNETIRNIPMEDKWVEQAKITVLENKSFAIDEAGNIKYSD